MKYLLRLPKIKKETWVAISVCFIFFVTYLILSLVKHVHFMSGYDLAIANQLVWQYSEFKIAIATVNSYAFVPGLWDHVEFIYIFLAPFYWILGDARTLIFLQALAVATSGIPVFLLARKYRINVYLSLSLLISYFTFYGIQNAIWSDVHSLVFGAAFLAFFIYFLDSNKKWLTFLFFFLAITSKEDIALLTLLISFVYLIRTRSKLSLYIMGGSITYLFIIFFIYFPYFTLGYRYANQDGLLSNINLLNFFNTAQKREVIFYSLSSFGFISLVNPLALVPFLGDLAHYFILGSDSVISAQSIFLHYRSVDALLLVWPTILVIAKYKKLNNKYLAVYLLIFTMLITYVLHSPLTYLSKKWFWQEPSGVKNIREIIRYIPKDARVVSHPNIEAHISNRDYLVTMFGDSKDFSTNSPCGEPSCKWFKWRGDPEFLVVDTSPEWNIINLLANRPDFISALGNMEKAGNITKYKEIGSSAIYKINKQPY